MNFYIKTLVIWLKNGKQRKLEFEPNKVNVITGKSGTGKSSILKIVDYCLLSSRARIVQEVINDNALWYGIELFINNQHWVIARGAVVDNSVSNDIYFSSNGTIPITPVQNAEIGVVKESLDKEFGITEKMVFPYGGKEIKAGSQLSFRYLTLLMTQSEDVISHENVFFDFDLHDRDRYKEAFDRIFDLVIGASDAETVLIKDRADFLEREIGRLERKKKKAENKSSEYDEQILELYSQAQDMGLAVPKLLPVKQIEGVLDNIVSEGIITAGGRDYSLIRKLKRDRITIQRKIRNLEKYKIEYNEYFSKLKDDYENLKPIAVIRNSFGELLESSVTSKFIDLLETQLKSIKESLLQVKPIEGNVDAEIVKLKSEYVKIKNGLNALSDKNEQEVLIGKEKFIFMGEIKAKLELIRTVEPVGNDIQLRLYSGELEQLKSKLDGYEDGKEIVMRMLHAELEKFKDYSKHVLGNYQNYSTSFSLKEKTLKMTAPNSIKPTSNIGSKSNFMFLHLFNMLGLHFHALKVGVKFVPNFLILDQISLPYFSDNSGTIEKLDDILDDDQVKLKEAFKLLNYFIDCVKKEKQTFQIILLEHARRGYWKDLNNIVEIEEFRDSNALIRPSDLI